MVLILIRWHTYDFTRRSSFLWPSRTPAKMSWKIQTGKTFYSGCKVTHSLSSHSANFVFAMDFLRLIRGMLTAFPSTFMTLSRWNLLSVFCSTHCNLHRSLSRPGILLKDVYLVPCISLKCSAKRATSNKSTRHSRHWRKPGCSAEPYGRRSSGSIRDSLRKRWWRDDVLFYSR